MYSNCAETHLGGGVLSILSSRWSPLLIDRSCDITYVAMRVLGHNNEAAKRYAVCERACGWTIFYVKA